MCVCVCVCVHVCVYVCVVADRTKPIPIDEFSARVKIMHANKDKLFESEYDVSSCILLLKVGIGVVIVIIVVVVVVVVVLLGSGYSVQLCL